MKAATSFRNCEDSPPAVRESRRGMRAHQAVDYLLRVRGINRHDFYTRSNRLHDLDDARARYQPIVEKYLGSAPFFF